jgi:hypothetical protein
MTAAKKARGRPAKAPEKGKRQNYTFRLHDETRERLLGAAKAANRTLSEEIEWRVEQSFKWEEAFGEARTIIDKATAAAAETERTREVAERQRALGGGFFDPALEVSVQRAVERALAKAGLTGGRT